MEKQMTVKQTDASIHVYRREKTPVVYRKGCVDMNSRVFPEGIAFEMLEPSAVKVACSVLRGLGLVTVPGYPTIE